MMEMWLASALSVLRTTSRLAFVILSLAVATGAAWAVEPDEILKDRALEARARHISAELRCLVCQNQSIDDSNAPLARDLRILVRERLKAGSTNQQVIDYVVARYGEFVLLKPRFALHTLVLWLAPLIVLVGGIVLARSAFRGGRQAEATAQPEALTDEERLRLKQLLNDDGVADDVRGSDVAGAASRGGRGA